MNSTVYKENPSVTAVTDDPSLSVSDSSFSAASVVSVVFVSSVFSVASVSVLSVVFVSSVFSVSSI